MDLGHLYSFVFLSRWTLFLEDFTFVPYWNYFYIHMYIIFKIWDVKKKAVKNNEVSFLKNSLDFSKKYI